MNGSEGPLLNPGVNLVQNKSTSYDCVENLIVVEVQEFMKYIASREYNGYSERHCYICLSLGVFFYSGERSAGKKLNRIAN